MTQTSDGKTFIKAAVDVRQTAADSWTDVDGFGASVAVTPGERNAPSQHTFDGDTPIVKGGKRSATEVEVRFVYTENEADPFEVARSIYEAEEGDAQVRYAPLGSGVGSFRFTSGSGVMTSFVYPQGNAEGDEIIMGGFTIVCPELTKEVV